MLKNQCLKGGDKSFTRCTSQLAVRVYELVTRHYPDLSSPSTVTRQVAAREDPPNWTSVCISCTQSSLYAYKENLK